MLNKAEDRSLARSALKRDCVFAGRFGAATIRERTSARCFDKLLKDQNTTGGTSLAVYPARVRGTRHSDLTG